MSLWHVGVAANSVLAGAYGMITLAILLPLMRDRQVRQNPLGTATALIFFTCAIGHGMQAAHALAPALGLAEQTGSARRLGFDLTTVVWDLLAAGVGLYYWSLRRQYASLVEGARLFADLRERQQQALEINDNILQGLVTAKLALDLDQSAVTREALESTLASARSLIADLLGEVQAGDLSAGLRRRHAAELIPPQDRHA